MLSKLAKKTEKKKKEDDPEYVSNTMKQLYENQLQAIRRKIERRQQWAQDWAEEIPRTEKEMQTHKATEDGNIKQLKSKLEELRAVKLQRREDVQKLTKEIEQDLFFYQQKIVEMEQTKLESAKSNEAEIVALDAEIAAVKEFKEQREELAAGLAERENAMQVLQERHEEKIEKLQERRQTRGKILKEEAAKQLKSFAEQFEKDSMVEGQTFEENARLLDELKYMKQMMQEWRALIAEAEQEMVMMRSEEKDLSETLYQLLMKMRIQCDEEAEQKETLSTEPESFDETNIPSSSADEEVTQVEPVVAGEKVCKAGKAVLREELKVRAVLKAARKVLAEAQALRLISEGALAEEANMSDQARALRYRARRDAVYQRRGEVLHYLLHVLAHGKLADAAESETIMQTPHFGSEQVGESDRANFEEFEEEERSAGDGSSSSGGSSLPRYPSTPRGAGGESEFSDLPYDSESITQDP